MAAITAQLIQDLRHKSGAGMQACKKALEVSDGDLEKALDYLRSQGIASAGKKESRETNEGCVAVSKSANAIALVELNSETDFVSRNEEFRRFAQDLADQAATQKFSTVEEFLSLPYAKDPSLTVDGYRSLVIQKLGENIRVKRAETFAFGADSSVGVYSHMNGAIISFVEITGSKEFETLAREIAKHVTAENPECINPEDLSEEIRSREEAIAREQIKGKPANMIEKIVEGKMKAVYQQYCLITQKFVLDESVTIHDLLAKASKDASKPLQIARFKRWRVGE